MTDTNSLLLEYAAKNMSHKEISLVMIKEHNIHLSSNAVGKRLLRCDYPPRRGSTGYSDAKLERKIKDMLQSSPPTVGYRHMTDKLRHLNIPVRRDKVMEIMRRIDPLGVDFRRRRRIKRKIYYSQGPNYILHVDGFSRRIMWLEVGPSNNDPEIVACNFVQTVAALRGIK
ncbi:uncharacterized protein LOC133206035 isoform X2 [Saccostrea echinata]|uniref:uncharacterized protein LOC133185811 isoform X2 n=1 Tax=Saccostrea echinata TaxID=191078 RepID=UPI002A800D81|nr:uncharacterized protein LOC133185811 isoform X2 [Saccostrea echinata]XP_061197926.1 uncharacterized protein LOC133206035 isoform X2 [Saccostrea echinata]